MTITHYFVNAFTKLWDQSKAKQTPCRSPYPADAPVLHNTGPTYNSINASKSLAQLVQRTSYILLLFLFTHKFNWYAQHIRNLTYSVLPPLVNFDATHFGYSSKYKLYQSRASSTNMNNPVSQ